MKRIINILLVEDDTLDQIEVARTLNKRHILHRLHIAKNGEDALRILQEEPAANMPDLILLDLNMPKMNGFELLSLIRENDHWKDIKIFILTTSDQSEDKTTTQALGISGFITKPLKLDSPSSMDAFNLMMDMMNM